MPVVGVILSPKAYRRQALRTHPDKGGSAEAFRQVLHAFEVLSSIRARAKYDSWPCWDLYFETFFFPVMIGGCATQ